VPSIAAHDVDVLPGAPMAIDGDTVGAGYRRRARRRPRSGHGSRRGAGRRRTSTWPASAASAIRSCSSK
jgi:hypothetical protein